MRTLPYCAVTSSGHVIDCNLELHPETVSPETVGRLVSALLNTLDGRIEGHAKLANGDVLQAIAMVLALRSEMLPAPREMKEQLVRDVVERALASVARATHGRTQVGRA
jgi:hypothetical protein